MARLRIGDAALQEELAGIRGKLGSWPSNPAGLLVLRLAWAFIEMACIVD